MAKFSVFRRYRAAQSTTVTFLYITGAVHSNTSICAHVYQVKCNYIPSCTPVRPEYSVLPIVPVWALGPSFLRGPSPGSGHSGWDENPLRSVSSDRNVRVKKLTVNIQARKHGKHRAQRECTYVTPHYGV